MHAPKYISHQFSGPDEQSRYAYDLNAFPQRESGTLLDTMFYFWNALRGNGASVPLSSQYEPRIIFGEQLPDLLSFVDARADNPENFVMIDHPKSSLDPFGSQLSGKTLGEFPNRLHRDALLLEYQICKRTQRPFYHEIDQIIGGISRHYVRLILPLVDFTGTISKFSVVTRRVSPTFRMFQTVEK